MQTQPRPRQSQPQPQPPRRRRRRPRRRTHPGCRRRSCPRQRNFVKGRERGRYRLKSVVQSLGSSRARVLFDGSRYPRVSGYRGPTPPFPRAPPSVSHRPHSTLLLSAMLLLIRKMVFFNGINPQPRAPTTRRARQKNGRAIAVKRANKHTDAKTNKRRRKQRVGKQNRDEMDVVLTLRLLRRPSWARRLRWIQSPAWPRRRARRRGPKTRRIGAVRSWSPARVGCSKRTRGSASNGTCGRRTKRVSNKTCAR